MGHPLVTPLVKDRNERKETNEIMDKIQAFLKFRDKQEEDRRSKNDKSRLQLLLFR
jgi:hypothetical protein